MDNFNKTLKNYLAGQGLSQSDVAEKLQLSRTIVSNYLNGQRNFGKIVANKWSDAFGIDPMWLMTKGDKGTPPDGVIQFSQPTIDPDIINIPILSPDARGGFMPNDEADIEMYTIGTMPFNKQIAHTGDVVIPVYGDSMTPKYPAGSYILIRPIEAWREYIELGRSYVLELADWRRLIKIVRKGSDATPYTLDSYNVDYESNEIAKSFINNMWLVVASVTREEL
jgi:transcriptional regulator with XRE-family HTH domain